MIDDIEDGKINCVITKDLSRLGRNYILTGQYTDIYFPSKGVRYIAVSDGVDSEKGESEIAPFLNILNEMHARQTSKKVKAAIKSRFLNGAHHEAYAPIGYKRHPEIKGKIIPDEDTRWIIEKYLTLPHTVQDQQKYALSSIRNRFQHRVGSITKNMVTSLTSLRINRNIKLTDGQYHKSNQYLPMRFISETALITGKPQYLLKTKEQGENPRKNGIRFLIRMKL